MKNGTLGTVTAVAAGRIEVRLDDDAKGAGRGRTVAVDTRTYRAFAHGYATTIHKSQGATVDWAFVLASASMDRHLSYVAMSWHREAVGLYAGRDQFPNAAAMTERLGRSGAKATTLDYAQAYAERRGLAGLAASLGLASRSEVTAPSAARAAVHATAATPGRAGVWGRLLDRLRPGTPTTPMPAPAAVREAGRRGKAETAGGAQPDGARLKAERLMGEWRDLEARQGALGGAGKIGERAEVAKGMNNLVRWIEADPKVAAIVQARGEEIGVAPALRAKIEPGRDRERGIEC